MAESSDMDEVFVSVRRKKSTIFLHFPAKETVIGLKKRIAAILNVPTQDLALYISYSKMMDEGKDLAFYGLTPHNTGPFVPAVIGLSLKDENGIFEKLQINPYSDGASTSKNN